MAPTLIDSLLRPECYPHEVDRVRHIETHISHVFLAGDHAYKLKKPVNLGFLDFSTSALRAYYCLEEVRLNRRLAPDLYLERVAITGTPAAPRIGGDGPVLEYAVHMRRFDPDLQFDHLLARGELQPEQVDALAQLLADFHAHCPAVGLNADYGAVESVAQPVQENFAQIRPLLHDAADLATLATIESRSCAALQALTARFEARRVGGYVRECHGDLHLGNIALIDGRPTPFDCIEFSESLRRVDVMSEMAFLVMDLRHRGRLDLAARCLNVWLEASGDYDGLAILPFYQCYRAMVRAKVACLTGAQADLSAAAQARAEFRHYLTLADTCSQPGRPALILTHGVSASGKTTVSQALLEALGAVRLRSDVERKRLHGLPALAKSDAQARLNLYGAAVSRQTYLELLRLTGDILAAGLTVIVDATFLLREARQPFRELAAQRGLPFLIVHCQADRAELRRRVELRQQSGRDASEADLAVQDEQWSKLEALTADETAASLAIDTGCDDLSQFVGQVKNRLELQVGA